MIKIYLAKDKLIKSIDKLKDRINGLSTSVRCFDGKNDWVSKQSQTGWEFDYILKEEDRAAPFYLKKIFKKFLVFKTMKFCTMIFLS